jgi:hypothetical protein
MMEDDNKAEKGIILTHKSILNVTDKIDDQAKLTNIQNKVAVCTEFIRDRISRLTQSEFNRMML